MNRISSRRLFFIFYFYLISLVDLGVTIALSSSTWHLLSSVKFGVMTSRNQQILETSTARVAKYLQKLVYHEGNALIING